MRLTKDQSRLRWAQIRVLWNEWDPIGVTALSNELHLGPSLRLLESGASLQVLRNYLADVELNRMGLSESLRAQKARIQFAARLREGYEKQWAETTA